MGCITFAFFNNKVKMSCDGLHNGINIRNLNKETRQAIDTTVKSLTHVFASFVKNCCIIEINCFVQQELMRLAFCDFCECIQNDTYRKLTIVQKKLILDILIMTSDVGLGLHINGTLYNRVVVGVKLVKSPCIHLKTQNHTICM